MERAARCARQLPTPSPHSTHTLAAHPAAATGPSPPLPLRCPRAEAARRRADRDVGAAAKVVAIIAKRNLREVRHLDKWVASLLRKDTDSAESHQPGDVEDLSRKVRDVCQAEIAAGRIHAEDLSERVISALNDLPVTQAVEVCRRAACEKGRLPRMYLRARVAQRACHTGLWRSNVSAWVVL